LRRHLPARWKPAAAVAVTAAFFLPLLVFGGPAFAHTGAAASEYEYSGSSQYQYRMLICHHTHSKKHPYHQITISSRAWKAHARHGDTQGACPTAAGHESKKHHGSRNQHANTHGDSHANSHANKGSDDSSTSGDASTHGSSGGEHGGGHGHGKP
jgi:hypothetical protein